MILSDYIAITSTGIALLALFGTLAQLRAVEDYVKTKV